MDVVPISQSFHDQARVPLICSSSSDLLAAHHRPWCADAPMLLALTRSAVFAAIAVLFTMPAAILIARYLRRSRWFPYHAGLQLVTLACLVIVFATGTRAVMSSGHGSEFAGKGADFHHKLGLAMFILVFAQALLGAFGHRLKPGHWVRHVHHVSGIVIAAFLYTQVRLAPSQWLDLIFAVSRWFRRVEREQRVDDASPQVSRHHLLVRPSFGRA